MSYFHRHNTLMIFRQNFMWPFNSSQARCIVDRTLHCETASESKKLDCEYTVTPCSQQLLSFF